MHPPCAATLVKDEFLAPHCTTSHLQRCTTVAGAPPGLVHHRCWRTTKAGAPPLLVHHHCWRTTKAGAPPLLVYHQGRCTLGAGGHHHTWGFCFHDLTMRIKTIALGRPAFHPPHRHLLLLAPEQSSMHLLEPVKQRYSAPPLPFFFSLSQTFSRPLLGALSKRSDTGCTCSPLHRLPSSPGHASLCDHLRRKLYVHTLGKFYV